MTLWTIQSLPAWQELQETGFLRASRHNICEHPWRSAYRWMTDQMHLRIGPPPEDDCTPIWAWYQWDGSTKRPDLRSRGHLPPGEPGVRIEFNCSHDAALLSDVSLWHFGRNYSYLPASEADSERFESELTARRLSFYDQKPLPDHAYHRRIVGSWERIFDLEWCEPDLSEPREQKSIQATLWELTLQQVTECQYFVGR